LIFEEKTRGRVTHDLVCKRGGKGDRRTRTLIKRGFSEIKRVGDEGKKKKKGGRKK